MNHRRRLDWLLLTMTWLCVTASPTRAALCAYATLYDADRIAVIDVEANAVTGYVPALDPGAVTISPDGQRVYVAAGAQRVIILDPTTHARIGAVKGLIGEIVDMVANADGKSLLVQTDQALQVVDLTDGVVRVTLRLQPGGQPDYSLPGVGCGLLRVTPDQRAALVVECSGHVRVYSLLDWFAPSLIAETDMAQTVAGAAIAADGQTMFLAGADASVHAFDARTGMPIWHTSIFGWIDDLALSPDGAQLLVLEGGWAELHSLDASSGNALSRTALPTYGKLSIGPDGRRAYLNETSGPLTLLNLETRESDAQLRLAAGPVAVALGDVANCGEPLPPPSECQASAVCLSATSVSGYPGETVTIAVSLHAWAEIAAVQSVIRFDPAAPVHVCRRNDDTQKPSAFAFRPEGCTRGVDCTSVISLTLSIDDVDPIPDGSVLFRCDVRIADNAPGDFFSFRITEIHASTPWADPLVGDNIDGLIRVLPREGSRSQEERAVSGSGGGCTISGGGAPDTSTAPLLVLLGFGLRRANLMLRRRMARRIR